LGKVVTRYVLLEEVDSYAKRAAWGVARGARLRFLGGASLVGLVWKSTIGV
jgi:hypothetical protein